nr:hypothetical protein B0A51_09485 [Rachicladosporium sp. CCFEE 5018]
MAVPPCYNPGGKLKRLPYHFLLYFTQNVVRNSSSKAVPCLLLKPLPKLCESSQLASGLSKIVTQLSTPEPIPVAPLSSRLDSNKLGRSCEMLATSIKPSLRPSELSVSVLHNANNSNANMLDHPEQDPLVASKKSAHNR